MAAGGGRLPSLGTVLVVDDEDSVGLIVGRIFRRWRVEQVETLAEGFERYGRMLDLRMAFVDLSLPDSQARCPEEPLRASFALVEQMRMNRPRVPVFILSGHLAPALVNAAQLAGAGYLAKVGYRENLMRLAERLEVAEQAEGWQRAELLEWLRDNRGATERQLEVADLAIQGKSRAEIAALLAISKDTVKQHMREVARRAGVRSASDLRDLARDIELP